MIKLIISNEGPPIIGDSWEVDGVKYRVILELQMRAKNKRILALVPAEEFERLPGDSGGSMPPEKLEA